eukprot:TRINITY_DN656_c0_g2_i2.p1 TRINITY_DN656_c0_g2~~TRINITY_DN656_c0_g2_i2.p1  ORF type:complete len:307 (-),score=89.14 TRINITY_DN656_c0_g2_i2:297-1217(-)
MLTTTHLRSFNLRTKPSVNQTLRQNYHVASYRKPNSPTKQQKIDVAFEQMQEIKTGDQHMKEGRYEQAYEEFDRARKIAESQFGDSPETRAVLRRVFDASLKLNKLAECQTIADSLIKSKTELADQMDGEQLQVQIYSKKKEWDVAVGLYGDLVQRSREKQNIPVLANALVEMGNIYLLRSDARQPQVAQSLYQQSLTNLEKAHLLNNPIQVVALNNMGCALQLQQKLPEAEEFFQVALKAIEKIEVDNKEMRGDILSNIGEIKHERGDVKGSQTYYGDAVLVLSDVLPKNHPKVADVFYKLVFST